MYLYLGKNKLLNKTNTFVVLFKASSVNRFYKPIRIKNRFNHHIFNVASVSFSKQQVDVCTHFVKALKV